MKKFFYFVLVTFIVASCSKSPEQKAEILIKDNLKKSLYKPDTYKPVETKVDSAFAPYDDPKFFAELEELGKLGAEYNELQLKVKMTKSSMANWGGSYQSAFAKNEYQEAKQEFEEASEQMEKVSLKCADHLKVVANMMKEERKFIGYKAIHNYRADNNAGQTLIGNFVFFIDKDFKEVIYSITLEDYNQVKDAIAQIKERVAELEKNGITLEQEP